MARNLLRNVRVFVSTVTTGFDNTNTWELAVQDDFSYSQGNETQEITVAESGAAPVRGQAVFNTALNPVEWSFSTYIRPFICGGTTNSGDHRAMEMPMWHALVASSATAPNWDDTSAPIDSDATSATIDFTTSNAHELYKYNLFVQADNIWYQIKEAQVNQAEVDFGIDAIGMITWSGNGTRLEDVTAGTHPGSGSQNIPTTTADYIKNRLTVLTITDNNNSNTVYTVPITGGNLTVNNNITYLTPDTLSTVDEPIGSFTGTRQISGNLTCYLNDSATGSGGLLKDMLSSAQITDTQNSYDIQITLGGASAPNVLFDIPTAHITVPNTEVADVIGLSIDFFALANSPSNIDGTDEMTVVYTAATTESIHEGTYYDAIA